MSEKGNPGINSLTNVFSGMIKAQTDTPPVLDFGIINADYSLTTNSFRQPIPKDEYSVCRSVTYNPKVPLTETYDDGEHKHPEATSPNSSHVHKVKLPEKMTWLQAGDEVLVAWVNHEAVVIDIIYNAATIGDEEPY